MDYFRFSKYEDELVSITSIKEEDEEIEPQREGLVLASRPDQKSLKRRLNEEKLLETQTEVPDLSHRYAGSIKSKRLGFKVSSSPETEFPLLIRGLETEKGKEIELIKKKSLKEGLFHQNSIDEDRDNSSLRSDSIPVGLTEEESNLELKVPQYAGDDSSSNISSIISPLEYKNLLHPDKISPVTNGDLHFKNRLFLAINDDLEDYQEVIKANLSKPMFYLKDKEESLLEVSMKELIKAEKKYRETEINNLELKKNIERLANDKKKLRIEKDVTENGVKNILTAINEEKMTYHLVTKDIESKISEAFDTQQDLAQQLIDSNKGYYKILEQLKEIEETWQMNINDLRISLYKVSVERESFETKVKSNQIVAEEMKVLSNLSAFQRDQIDLCLEMLVKSMNFFAENKEHISFNRKYKEALLRIKQASHDSLKALEQFEKQATTDPRELLPYTRVSDTGPGSKQDRINLSSKMNNSKITIKDLY